MSHAPGKEPALPRVRRAARRALLTMAALGATSCLPIDPIPFMDIVVEARTPDGAAIQGLRAEAVGGLGWTHPRAIEFTGADGVARLRVPVDPHYELRVYAPDSTWTPAVAVDTVQALPELPTQVFEFTPPS